MRLDEKVIIITGAGYGIGKVYSRGLASEGAKIVDISLQGLGRSAGNASFETLVFLLMRYGFKLKIDLIDSNNEKRIL